MNTLLEQISKKAGYFNVSRLFLLSLMLLYDSYVFLLFH